MMARTQRQVLLLMTSAYRTVSGMALEVITRRMPIELMAQEIIYIYQHRDTGGV